MLMNFRTYVNGSSSGPRPNTVTATSLSAEHWGVLGHLSNTMTKEIAESCVSHNTQKLTSSLFTWSTDPKNAEAYMNTYYNSVLALQSAETGRVVYHLSLGSPRIKNFLKENDFRCGNGSSIEVFAQLNSRIYYYNDFSLWINLNVPSEINWPEKGISIEQTGYFPSDPVIEFIIAAKRKSLLSIRMLVPSWANNTEIYINGNKQDINLIPGSYSSLDREWRNNDKIKLVFHYDFYLRTMPDDKNVIALFYGPVLLAFETRSELILKGSRDSILNNVSIVDMESCTFELVNGGKEYKLRPLFDIEEQSYGVYATIRNY